MKTSILFLYFAFFLLISCSKKENLEQIIVFNEYGDNYLFINNKKLILYTNFYSFTESDKKDSIIFIFKNNEWQELENSFKNNHIFSLNEKNYDISFSENHKKYVSKYLIKTNYRNIEITENMKLEKHTINHSKTQKFNLFSNTIDSILYSKMKEKKL